MFQDVWNCMTKIKILFYIICENIYDYFNSCLCEMSGILNNNSSVIDLFKGSNYSKHKVKLSTHLKSAYHYFILFQKKVHLSFVTLFFTLYYNTHIHTLSLSLSLSHLKKFLWKILQTFTREKLYRLESHICQVKMWKETGKGEWRNKILQWKITWAKL